MDFAISLNNHKIRLTPERWFHITEGHPEVAGYYFEVLDSIENPDFVYKGNQEELLAVKAISENKFMVVIYKELDIENGFVITSFLSNKIKYLKNKIIIWERKK